MMKARTAHLLQTAIACALSLSTALACGPDFYADVFVRASTPDLPKQFVRGRLGILQPGFPRADLFVAYRYLNGGTLTVKEQAGWSPAPSLAEEELSEPAPAETPETPTAAGRWTAARAAYPGAPNAEVNAYAAIKIAVTGGGSYEDSILNCSDDAFSTAMETMQSRAATWGKGALLADWLRAQDTVFADCSSDAGMPPAAPLGSPALLLQDRAYQTAAAHFYSRQYPEALAEFRAIGNDAASPWREASAYIAGRVLMRMAFAARPSADDVPDFDAVKMKAAEVELTAFLRTGPSARWKRAAEQSLAMASIRVTPDRRGQELARALAGPGEDSAYAQDAIDLLWRISNNTPDGLRARPQPWDSVSNADGTTRYLSPEEARQAAVKKRAKAYTATAHLRGTDPLVDWTLTVQALAPDTATHAMERWQSTRTLPWLVAALMKSTAAPDAALLDAAAAVSEASPAWQTVTYHRARLLLAAGRSAEARTVLQGLTNHLQAEPREQREPSSMNAARGLLMLAAADRESFFANLPRQMLLSKSENAYAVEECLDVMTHKRDWHHCSKAGDTQMDDDAADALNFHASLAVWQAAAASPALPKQVRASIAAAGWARATLLRRPADAAAFLPDLPDQLRSQAAAPGPGGPLLVLLRNPGLRPYVNGGVQRGYSYDFVESYRDNWCYRPDEPAATVPATLTAEERRAGEADAAALAGLRAVDTGREVTEAVAANPAHPQGAEAMYLVLRMIRYGCVPPRDPKVSGDTTIAMPYQHPEESAKLLQLQRDSSRLLRRHYAASPWTKRAAPFAR